MSFTSEVKAEITRNEWNVCCQKAQCMAFLQISSRLHINSEGMYVSVHTQNPNTAKYIWKLIKELYDIEPQLSVWKKMNLRKHNTYEIKIYENALNILKDLDLYGEDGLHEHPSMMYLKSACCQRAYLAAVFLACGSINSPTNANYHLELAVGEMAIASFILKIMAIFDMHGKIIQRRKQFIVYMKASEKIGDFLRCINTSDALFVFEDSRIQRDFMNSLTRLDNCELANEMKSIAAAQVQLEEIEWIENYKEISDLPVRIQRAIAARKALPDGSLLELCEYCDEHFDEQISKSGMKHRLAKVKEIAALYKSAKL